MRNWKGCSGYEAQTHRPRYSHADSMRRKNARPGNGFTRCGRDQTGKPHEARSAIPIASDSLPHPCSACCAFALVRFSAGGLVMLFACSLFVPGCGPLTGGERSEQRHVDLRAAFREPLKSMSFADVTEPLRFAVGTRLELSLARTLPSSTEALFRPGARRLYGHGHKDPSVTRKPCSCVISQSAQPEHPANCAAHGPGWATMSHPTAGLGQPGTFSCSNVSIAYRRGYVQ